MKKSVYEHAMLLDPIEEKLIISIFNEMNQIKCTFLIKEM